MTSLRTQGFSMIELILVLALIGVVALFTVPLTMDSLTRSSVTQERDLFVSLVLRGARAAALANIDQKSHGIHINPTEYVLFDTPVYSATAASNRRIPFSNSAIAVSSSNGSDIIFQQRSGDVIAGVGTISFSRSGGQTQTVVIRESGQIDW